MRMADVKAQINIFRKEPGYRVSFERRGGGFLKGDMFPERDEPPISDEEIAWEWAKQFAMANHKGEVVNIYVIRSDFTPVPGYKDRIFYPYPSPPEP